MILLEGGREGVREGGRKGKEGEGRVKRGRRARREDW